MGSCALRGHAPANAIIPSELTQAAACPCKFAEVQAQSPAAPRLITCATARRLSMVDLHQCARADTHCRRAAVAAVKHHLERAREAAAAQMAVDGGQPVLHRLQCGRGEHAQPARHVSTLFPLKRGSKMTCSSCAACAETFCLDRGSDGSLSGALHSGKRSAELDFLASA